MYSYHHSCPPDKKRVSRFRSKSLGVVVGLLSVVSALTLASPANAASGSSVALKPTPQAPSLPAQSANKPHLASPNTIRPLIAWSVNLSASSTSLWPTQYSTLTATTNQDVGPTPYYLRIYDSTSGTYVATCGTGTTCSTSVTQATAATHGYLAVVAYYTTTYPPTGLQATSSTVWVTWRSISVSLAASADTTTIGSSSTLTASTSSDVGPTPFYTEIYDATTGVRIGVCGTGTTCSASTTQWVATTHQFVAYVSMYSTTFPPAGVQAVSARTLITWANTGYRVSLSAPAFTFGSSFTATATTNVDVGPTPYWIEIFNQNGTRLAVCGSGTTCSATVTAAGTTHLVAFVSSYDTNYLPANIQASSNTTTTTRFIIFTNPAVAR